MDDANPRRLTLPLSVHERFINDAFLTDNTGVKFEKDGAFKGAPFRLCAFPRSDLFRVPRAQAISRCAIRATLAIRYTMS
jgi:hypothetical protein